MAHDYFPSVVGKEGGFDRPLTALPYCEGDYWPGMAETYSVQYREGTLVVPADKLTNSHMASVPTSLGLPLPHPPSGESVLACLQYFGVRIPPHLSR